MSPPVAIAYVSDLDAGIQRRRLGRGFAYLDHRGTPVSPEEKQRAEGLVIPPAWTDVWICLDPKGHIQATGRDARGRKQYIYHPDWRAWREDTKFEHILQFAAVLPALRERVRQDLAHTSLDRSSVVAAAVRVMDETLMRVGNDEYARHNGSYGLTTLRGDHLKLSGARLRFSFKAKSGKQFEAEFSDRRVAAILRRLEGLPGQHLFQYVDDAGATHRISSDDVNAYIREATGGDFTAKDFRTWAATALAVIALLKPTEEVADSHSARKRLVTKAVRTVAARLSNTPAVCRSSYIHPDVIESYLDGSLASLSSRIEGEEVHDALLASEQIVLRFLKRRQRQRELPAAA